MKTQKFLKHKIGALEFDHIGKWVIALAILLVVLGIYLAVQNSSGGLIDALRNLL